MPQTLPFSSQIKPAGYQQPPPPPPNQRSSSSSNTTAVAIDENKEQKGTHHLRKRSERIIFHLMGLCVSSCDEPTQAAMVILPNGSLQEFRLSVSAKQVLDANPDCFVCNSDSMCYDETIPPMAPQEELLPGQVYFVLPEARLKLSLSASDMAALAVKASLAMQRGGKKAKGRRAAFGRVVPVCDRGVRVGSDEFKTRAGGGLGKVELRRPGSTRRLQRVASRKSRFACGSFKLGLSTIHEEDTVN